MHVRDIRAGRVTLDRKGHVHTKRTPRPRRVTAGDRRAVEYAALPVFPMALAVRTWVLDGVRLVSEANSRDHWAARNSRKATQQRAWYRLTHDGYRCALPVHVTIVRIGPRKLDSDNLAGSAKGLRDEIARWLGCDDGDESKVTWEYRQERGEYAVRVEVRAR